jgi:N-methylhydantoinase B
MTDTSERSEPYSDIDPITAEVVRCAYDNIADEMAVVLLRTSGSPVLTEAKDFSAVLFDVAGRQVGSAGYVLGHLASSRLAVLEIMDKRLPNDLGVGDIFICNDPYSVGALHQGDVGIVMPIHKGNALIGWAFTNAHLLDVGGSSISGMAPQAHDCFEEAIRFPGTRIGSNGLLDPEWLGLIGTNVRMPLSFINDVRSLVASCLAGGVRMRALVDEYGMETLGQYTDYNIELTEKAFRTRIAELPEGISHTYDWVEYDGRGTSNLYPVECEMSVGAGHLSFKFSGAEQIDAFINATPSAVAGIGVITPILCQLAHDIPINEGIWNCIDIDTGPIGTIVNPQVPAPVTNAHMETGARVGRMVNEALSIACSVSDLASIRGRCCGQTTNSGSGAAWFGARDNGDLAIIFPLDNLVAGGGGAQTTGDGQDLYGYQTTLSVSFPDVEVHELVDPFFVLWRRYATNSGGAGYMRGGMAMDQAYMLWGADKFSGSGFQAAVELPARGFAGAYPGGTGRSAILRGANAATRIKEGKSVASPDLLSGSLEVLPGKVSNVPLNSEDVYWAASSGSGGLGDPFHRAPGLIERDLKDAKISAAAAEGLYGAVLSRDNGALTVDVNATWLRRDRIRASLVPEKQKSLEEVAGRGTGVRAKDGLWICAACENVIGKSQVNWKNLVPPQKSELLGEVFSSNETQVRARDVQPAKLISRYCPNCGSSLSVDIGVEEHDSTPSGFQFH